MKRFCDRIFKVCALSAFIIGGNSVTFSQNNIFEITHNYLLDSSFDCKVLINNPEFPIVLVNKFEFNYGKLISFSQLYQDTSGLYPTGTYIKLNPEGKLICIGQYETDLKCLNYPEQQFSDSIYFGKTFSGIVEFGYYKFPRVGKWLSFDAEGNIMAVSYYENNYLPFHGCIEKKTGTWKYFDNKGFIIDSVTYDSIR